MIAESGIKKNITWHMSRHTYATEICMLNGVPIETISKMLGHSDIKTTQIYAKLSDTVVERDMEALSEKLSKISEFSAVLL
ncbi:MAG: tyrosine-type recombinase/integrase [Rikenellaceae bacterium]|nr:tyrosine-type recombinase/integrase [Rikenellaceae bacterium]